MHQLVQYHLVPDAMDLACRLLSLEPKYPPCAELAMDMFRRLGPLGNDALMRCLLSRGMLLSACRFIRAQRLLNFPPRPLLVAAAGHKDRASLFPAIFHFFLQRNEVWRGAPDFLPEEDCDEFVALWERSYGDTAARGGLPQACFRPLGAAADEVDDTVARLEAAIVTSEQGTPSGSHAASSEPQSVSSRSTPIVDPISPPAASSPTTTSL